MCFHLALKVFQLSAYFCLIFRVWVRSPWDSLSQLIGWGGGAGVCQGIRGVGTGEEVGRGGEAGLCRNEAARPLGLLHRPIKLHLKKHKFKIK